jgi:hypothetical protein
MTVILKEIIDFEDEIVKNVIETSKINFIKNFKMFYSGGKAPSASRVSDWSLLCAFIQDSINKNTEIFNWDSVYIYPSGFEGKLVDLIGLYHNGWVMLDSVGLFDPVTKKSFS